MPTNLFICLINHPVSLISSRILILSYFQVNFTGIGVKTLTSEKKKMKHPNITQSFSEIMQSLFNVQIHVFVSGVEPRFRKAVYNPL